jgi:hypothetical protein
MNPTQGALSAMLAGFAAILTLTSSVLVVAFQAIRIPATCVPTHSRTRTFSKIYSSKDDEIAELEEKLQKLKQAKEAEESSQAAATPQNGEVAAKAEEEEVDIGMFLSEGWKEKEATESGGSGGLTGIIGAVALVLGLIAFSQVPIGQEDLSKYSAMKAPTEQIDLGDLNRARNAGDL